MASYTVTSCTGSLEGLNVGDPFGYIPVIFVKIGDSFANNVNVGDNLSVMPTVLDNVKALNDEYPTTLSVGGTLTEYEAGNFSGYTYPLQSTAIADGTYIKLARSNVSSRWNLYIQLFLKGDAGHFMNIAAERFSSHLRPLWIFENDEYLIITTPGAAPELYYTATTNMYLSADNNGLPYNIIEGSEWYQPQTALTGTITKLVKKSEVDYKDYEIDSDDPYDNGGDSDTGGGTGDFNNNGDNINHPGLPGLSAVDTGFITLFNPSVAQLKSLANYMWSGAFDLDTFKKIFADPMDAILGLSIVPVAVPNGGTESVKIGNISTTIAMTKAASQYVTINCGSLNVNEYWGAYLDYSPYTKAEIYLPYIGTHAINIDDIMGKTVSVQYNVDILSGACNATVKCGAAVLYEFIGHCAASIPVSGNDWTNVLNGVLSVAGSIGSMVATSGMTAPLAVGTIASAAVNDSKPTVEKSGSLSGTGSLLGIQKPYLMITRPRQAKPKKQNIYLGYPSFTTQKVEDLNGYAEFEEIHLENIHASLEEIEEIETIMKSGVIC